MVSMPARISAAAEGRAAFASGTAPVFLGSAMRRFTSGDRLPGQAIEGRPSLHQPGNRAVSPQSRKNDGRIEAFSQQNQTDGELRNSRAVLDLDSSLSQVILNASRIADGPSLGE